MSEVIELAPYLYVKDGVPYITVPFSQEEMQELIWLIDDDPVDEEILTRIRQRLRKHIKNLRLGLRKHSQPA